ncbi:hypothetical protein KP509_31G008000 [Ceratopteris richardii]|uniref:F-box/LRR-repeat protein 15-like leucin rich repeat domain-containing protein n=1 Tax=Ceratopteris richardii TaxID=49495 RepID=A0A8T2QV88_CERRI|nr:hypothetical protein KP509_31G008000 [Ceratopteris richardii]
MQRSDQQYSMTDEATGIQSPKLVEMCLNAACESKESVQTWRKQIRTLERLPAHLAHPLFHRLLHSGLLNPPLLEVFRYCIEEVVLSGDSSISAEWTVYFKSFKYLRILKAVSCKSLTNVALFHIAGLADTLQELDISCCPKITDEGLSHVLALKNLEGLGISETKITANGVQQLCILKNLRYLDMGGLPVTDSSLCVLTSLTRLESLYVWGSKISDQGVLQLKKFPNLQMVNLAWTEVTRIPSLQSLKYLNMAKCTVASIFEGWNGLDVQLEELNLSGTNIQGPLEVIAGIGAHNLLTVNLSSSNFKDVTFLTGLSKIGVLDLSGTMINDAAMDIIRSIGANLKHLDLSGCRITSGGVGAFARHVPSLEQLHLSGTLVDDCVFEYLQFVHVLKVLDLSFTNIKGNGIFGL